MENFDVTDDSIERYWVLVADGHEARFLHGVSPSDELEEFYKMTSEDARKSGDEIDTDSPGRRRDSGHSVSTLGQPTTGQRSAMPADPVEHAKEEFAGRVAEWLDNQRGANRFDRLAVIAAPNFLGDFRNKMSPQLQKTVMEEVDKNLTNHKAEEIRAHLQKLKD